MKKVLGGLSILIVVSVLLSGLIAFLAENHPFDPGDLLFPIQELAEKIRYRLSFDSIDRVNLALDLAFRRLEELQRSEEPADIALAAKKFEDALDKAIVEVTQSDLSEREGLLRRLN